MLGRLYHNSLLISKRLKFSNRFRSIASTTVNQKPKQKKTGIWAVEVTEADPDWKRPRASFTTAFFYTKNAAEEYKHKLMEDQLEDFKESFESEDFMPEMKHLTDGTYDDKIYKSRGYMHMAAFEVQVFEVEIQDAKTE